MKQTYKIEGMHCKSCARLIDLQVKRLDGVEQCEVDFSTARATVDFDEKKQSFEDINKSISSLGYSLSPM